MLKSTFCCWSIYFPAIWTAGLKNKSTFYQIKTPCCMILSARLSGPPHINNEPLSTQCEPLHQKKLETLDSGYQKSMQLPSGKQFSFRKTMTRCWSPNRPFYSENVARLGTRLRSPSWSSSSVFAMVSLLRSSSLHSRHYKARLKVTYWFFSEVSWSSSLPPLINFVDFDGSANSALMWMAMWEFMDFLLPKATRCSIVHSSRMPIASGGIILLTLKLFYEGPTLKHLFKNAIKSTKSGIEVHY